MSVLIILLICSILVAAVFLIGFIWSVSSGQYEDDQTPSIRMLFDDEIIKEQSDQSKNIKPTSHAK